MLKFYVIVSVIYNGPLLLIKEKEKNSSIFVLLYIRNDKANLLTKYNVGRNFTRRKIKEFELFKNHLI